jgi:hypothetical protein
VDSSDESSFSLNRTSIIRPAHRCEFQHSRIYILIACIGRLAGGPRQAGQQRLAGWLAAGWRKSHSTAAVAENLRVRSYLNPTESC